MENTSNKKSFFSSPLFLLIIISLTMFNNLEHGAELYYKITEPIYPGAWLPYIHLQAYFVIIVIDLAVIGFIVNGKTKDSKAFAWLLFFINLIFWDVLTGISQTHYKDVQQISLLVAKIFFSAAFSYLIHKVSSLYFEKINGFSSMEQLKAECEQMKALEMQLKAELKDSVSSNLLKQSEILNLKVLKTELENKYNVNSLRLSRIEQELTCPSCSEYKANFSEGVMSAIKALNAHKGICIKKVSAV